MSYYEDRMAELRAERAREAVEREKRRDEELEAKRKHRASNRVYTIKCLHCGFQTLSKRQRMYCNDECRKQATNLRKLAVLEKRLTAPANVAEPNPILSAEVLYLQGQQRKDRESRDQKKAAREMKAELEATSYRLEGGMSEAEREAFRAEMESRVKQGRNRVHAYFMGHGPSV